MCCGLQMTAVRDGAGWRVFDGAGWRMRQIVMSRTTAHTGRRASVYEGPRKTNQRGKKRGRSMILTDTPVQNALERKPRRWKEPQAVRWRERSFRRNSETCWTTKNTEWEAGQCLVCDEPWATAGRVISGWAARTVASVSTRIAQAGINVMFATIIVNLTNVCPYLRLLSPCWVFGTIKCLSLTHINGALTYPGVRVNLPPIWGRLTHVKRCHITYNTQNTTILVICISAYGCKWYILECVHAMIICENNTVFAKSDFWSKTR